MIVIGTTAALGAAGLTLGTGRARGQATVELGSLDLPDAELGAEDGEVYAPHVLLDGEWSYRNLESEAAEWRAYLLVTPPGEDSWSAIGLTDGDASGTEASGAFQLRGAVTASSDFAPEDFSVADDGSPRTVGVTVAVLFMVLDADGNRLAETQVTRDVAITVKETGATARVGAAGTVEAQDDHDDPTPTYAGGS